MVSDGEGSAKRTIPSRFVVVRRRPDKCRRPLKMPLANSVHAGKNVSFFSFYFWQPALCLTIILAISKLRLADYHDFVVYWGFCSIQLNKLLYSTRKNDESVRT